ncbi:hypothetical protein AYL99_12013 [Fonsecaea erecta]|uniref:Uncharacterized protein n=1 Tax=Fonsecaea erecta TaxID=1367422 RepID=A0A178Z271_9EURO|nr:hypothetical protein AYL99_12013 [Fonsecaea erecta]OAP53794.1 hypothetical protein AYL99_12013 [Fonsecaea erecta]
MGLWDLHLAQKHRYFAKIALEDSLVQECVSAVSPTHTSIYGDSVIIAANRPDERARHRDAVHSKLCDEGFCARGVIVEEAPVIPDVCGFQLGHRKLSPIYLYESILRLNPNSGKEMANYVAIVDHLWQKWADQKGLIEHRRRDVVEMLGRHADSSSSGSGGDWPDDPGFLSRLALSGGMSTRLWPRPTYKDPRSRS